MSNDRYIDYLDLLSEMRLSVEIIPRIGRIIQELSYPMYIIMPFEKLQSV